MKAQRWFGAKSRTLETTSIRDWLLLTNDPPAFLVSVRAYFNDGRYDVYAVPMAVAVGADREALETAHPGAMLAHVKGPAGAGVVYDATLSDSFCNRLLAVVASGEERKSQTGRLRGVPTSAFAEVRGEGDPGPIRRGSAEQSNTTIIFGDRLLLKMFRRVESGVNPDFEIGRFLTEKAHFPRTPKTAGALEYRKARNEPATLAIVQELVPNQGQGWEWALDVLGRYYEQVDSEAHRLERVEAPQVHLVGLSEVEPLGDVQEVVGTALLAAGVLGRRTAEMHRALASDPADPSFAPEPLLPDELRALSDRLAAFSRATFQTLRSRLDGLSGPVRQAAETILGEGPALLARAGDPASVEGPLVKTRVHGDYHLGQVLWQENDFIILDFEGEPGRTLAERRAKQSPLKDVAGMLRSFDYAAYSELLGFTADGPERFEKLVPWARLWRTWTSAAFLRGYREAAAPELLPGSAEDLSRLLDFFVLEKLMWELHYEMNYRPEWVHIPLLGILGLTRPEGVAAAAGNGENGG
jgi:maltose alpha-D-glucosyltransferase/alpha-amylase